MQRQLFSLLTCAALALAATTAEARQPGRAFTALDQDRDGALSRQEVDNRPCLARQFANIDSNRDGRLSREELRAARQRKHMQKVDTNADGRISRQEANDFRPLLERFDRLDKDHDGTLNPSEMAAGRGGAQPRCE